MTAADTTFDRPRFSSVILLVEDEPVLRSSIARGLNKLTNVEVLSAANLAEAMALLDMRTPALVISDIDLPDGAGVELIGELKGRKVEIPIIFVTAYLKTYRAQIPEHPNVLVLEKPIPLEELRARVLRMLGPAGEAARGPFTVVEYVQLACLGRHSVQVDVELVDGASYIIVHEGELWSAVDRDGTGEEAFKRVVMLKEGTVTCASLVGPPGVRTITRRWEQLVLESACELDESRRDAHTQSASDSRLPALAGTPRPVASDRPKSQGDRAVPASVPAVHQQNAAPPRTAKKARLPPPFPARNASAVSRTAPAVTTVTSDEKTEVTPAPKPPSFDELWSRGVDALLRREYGVAVESFVAASKLRPEDLRIQANLLRLKEMGYVKQTGGDQ